MHTLHLDWNEPREALLDHRVDAAVTRLPIPTDGLHVTILYDEPRLLLVPLDHRLAGKESVTLDDIADEPIPRLPDPAWNAYWRIDPRPTEAPPPTAPSSRPSRTSSSSSPPGRPSPSSRPAPGRQPPPRPHHRPAPRRRAEPRRAGHPRRRPQPPGSGLPQIRPGPPHRPRVELFASVKFRRLTDPRNLPISGSVRRHHITPGPSYTRSQASASLSRYSWCGGGCGLKLGTIVTAILASLAVVNVPAAAAYAGQQARARRGTTFRTLNAAAAPVRPGVRHRRRERRARQYDESLPGG